jgi:HemY protein
MALQDVSLYRSAWRALAELAEARDDAAQAMAAWKRAAQTEDL